MNKRLTSRKDGVPVAILCDQFQQRLQSPYDLVAGFTEFVPLHTVLRMPRDTLDTVRFNRTFTIATMSLSGIGFRHDVRIPVALWQKALRHVQSRWEQNHEAFHTQEPLVFFDGPTPVTEELFFAAVSEAIKPID